MARVITALTSDRTRHSIACLEGDAVIADRLAPQTRIHCLHKRPNELQLPFRLARLIRTIRPTVIHARNWGAWPDVAVGRLLARPIVPLVFSFHGLGRAGYMPLRRRLASRVLARMTTHLFTVSEQSRRLLLDHWGWPGGRTRVIPNGVDTERFAPPPSDEAQAAKSARTVIGTVGNLRTVKNHAMLIKACAKLAREGRDIELRIAGQGDQHDSLLELAESLQFAGRLNLCGRVEDVPAFLRQLDLFALSSDSEQHPNALNEAMACGLACVSTRVGCVDELLDAGRCGIITEPGDAEGMARGLEKLIDDSQLRLTLGRAARDHVCRRYSQQVMVDAYREMYESVSSGAMR